MFGVYLTAAIIFITWIFWNIMDNYYRKNPMKLYNIKKYKKYSWDEIVYAVLAATSIIGIAYSILYIIIS